MSTSLTGCRFRISHKAAPSSTYRPDSHAHRPATTKLTHTKCTRLDTKSTLFTRSVDYIDLQLIYTILGLILYTYYRKRDGSICSLDPELLSRQEKAVKHLDEDFPEILVIIIQTNDHIM